MAFLRLVWSDLELCDSSLVWHFTPLCFSPLLLAVKVFEIFKMKVFLWNKRTQQAVKLLCVLGGSVGRENLPLKIQVKAGRNLAYGFECSHKTQLRGKGNQERTVYWVECGWNGWKMLHRVLQRRHSVNFHIHHTEGSQKSRQITFKGGTVTDFFFCFILCFVFVEMQS